MTIKQHKRIRYEWGLVLPEDQDRCLQAEIEYLIEEKGLEPAKAIAEANKELRSHNDAMRRIAEKMLIAGWEEHDEFRLSFVSAMQEVKDHLTKTGLDFFLSWIVTPVFDRPETYVLEVTPVVFGVKLERCCQLLDLGSTSPEATRALVVRQVFAEVCCSIINHGHRLQRESDICRKAVIELNRRLQSS